MLSNLAISADGLGKTFRTYSKPIHRVLSQLPTFATLAVEHHALSDVDLKIDRGECVAILGPNGSGKSTFLRIVSGTMAPSKGTLSIRGEVAGILELGAGFLPDLTGRENAIMNAMVSGVSEKEAIDRLPWIREFADIGDYVDRPVRSYSSGMFVRLAFAVAAAARPDILVIDEALAVGDVAFQQKCHAHMRNAMESATRLFVSHDVSRLSAICERSIVLHKGKVVYDGPTERGIVEYLKLSHEQTLRVEVAGLESSGPREIDITDVRVTVEGTCGRDVTSGQKVTMDIELENHLDRVGVVYGAIWTDDTGQAIFSSNSQIDGLQPIQVHPGKQRLQFDFPWPDVRRGAYSLTVGVGSITVEGAPQRLQCWVHGCAKLQCINSIDMHGLFRATMTRS
jgi:ABC-type polysaccharide/polyol phosphate transport system ATPase subunit